MVSSFLFVWLFLAYDLPRPWLKRRVATSISSHNKRGLIIQLLKKFLEVQLHFVSVDPASFDVFVAECWLRTLSSATMVNTLRQNVGEIVFIRKHRLRRRQHAFLRRSRGERICSWLFLRATHVVALATAGEPRKKHRMSLADFVPDLHSARRHRKDRSACRSTLSEHDLHGTCISTAILRF